MSYFDDASLVMIPSGYKDQKVYSVKPIDGSGDLTFSRASSATRVNSSGLVEKVRTNLLLQSNGFDTASWTKNLVSVTAGQSGYDGTNNAFLITNSAGTSTEYRIRQDAISISAGLNAVSVYMKAGTSNFGYIQIVTATENIYFLINLTTGATNTLTAGIGVFSENVGNGWWRIKSFWTSASASVSFRVGIASSLTTPFYTSAGGDSIVAQAAQLEAGDIATDYIATTSAAVSVGPVSGLPRLDYSGGCPSLLLEPQRTNLLQYSEQFDNAYWVKNTTTVTANALISPDGYQNADIFEATGGLSRVQKNPALGAGTYTVSVYMKAESGSGTARILCVVDGGVVEEEFTITTTWQRFTSTFTASSSVTDVQFRASSFLGNIGIWGAQLEAGAYATSYIPTLSTAVTRVGDSALKTGISSLIGSATGTVFFDVDNVRQTGTADIDLLTLVNEASPTLGAYVLNFRQSGNMRIYNLPDNSQYTVKSGDNLGQRLKIAFAYASGDFVCYVNGVQTFTSSSVGTTSGLSKIGINDNAIKQGVAEINQLLLFPTRLSNADLATLTTI